MNRDDVMMDDPMADETAPTPGDLEGARVAMAGVMARILACEASVAAVQARQESHDVEIRRVRRDINAIRAESAGDF